MIAIICCVLRGKFPMPDIHPMFPFRFFLISPWEKSAYWGNILKKYQHQNKMQKTIIFTPPPSTTHTIHNYFPLSFVFIKREVVWPWFEIAFTSTLKLCFCRQSFPRPLTVFDSIVPGHMYNRVIHSGIYLFCLIKN